MINSIQTTRSGIAFSAEIARFGNPPDNAAFTGDAHMTGHKNRSQTNRRSASSPTAAEILAAREYARLTQTEAAQIIYSTLRTWQDWEAGARRCHPAIFELFIIKTGQVQR